MPRTIFLDVVDPSVPEETQRAIDAQLEELRDFAELRPPLWKRLAAAWSSGCASGAVHDAASVVACGCSVLDAVAVVECGGCV